MKINFNKVNIDKSWINIIHKELNSPYIIELKKFLYNEIKNNIIYPKCQNIFCAFQKTTFDDIKIVILGQDPYHNFNQANGLAFSVNDHINIPPSLLNIYKEIANDIIGFKIPKSGNLTKWALQGILLLNSVLTVRKNMPGSHQNKGWEIFTDNIIHYISQNKKNIIFLLWGKYAASKGKLIDKKKHYIFYAAHPSPLSAHKGFFGCNHFSKSNRILKHSNKSIIDWQI
ncbi:MAG: uracil-DNA glycosylase [Bacteroides sp.]|nr:MAG: uracil-DNA glycosylase [Bacteroides sp.]